MDLNFDALGISQQEYERNRESVLRDLKVNTAQPLSFEAFKKTPQERIELENAKAEWRAYMKAHGLGKRCGKVNAN
jgi:hypothetical protein